MGNRLFHILVFALWLLAMSWLVVAKVLPPLRVGDRPARVLADSASGEETVGWRIELDGIPVGWSRTRTGITESHVTEVESRVVIRGLPMDELTPAWLAAMARKQLGYVDLDSRTFLEIDPLGELSSFRSSIGIPGEDNLIRIQGRVENSNLLLNIRAGDLDYSFDKSLPAGALVTGEFSPQSSFSQLALHQTWTVPVFSPLRSPSSPLEILQATVESEGHLMWDGSPRKTLVVVYRSDPGAGSAASRTPRGRLWVDERGRVLRQEIGLLRSQLRFERMTETELAICQKAEEATETTATDEPRDGPARRTGGPTERP